MTVTTKINLQKVPLNIVLIKKHFVHSALSAIVISIEYYIWALMI